MHSDAGKTLELWTLPNLISHQLVWLPGCHSQFNSCQTAAAAHVGAYKKAVIFLQIAIKSNHHMTRNVEKPYKIRCVSIGCFSSNNSIEHF